MAAPAAPNLDDLLRLPERELFKADQRSRVWRVDDGGSTWVIKRYEHSAVKQRLMWVLNQHPIRREQRANAAMAREGLPVTPIVAAGMHRGKGCIATPYIGPSLQAVAQQRLVTERRRIDTVIDSLAGLFHDLCLRGWYVRDFKLANLVIGEGDRVCMIDLVGVRRRRGAQPVNRMASLLAKTARDEGVPLTDRVRFMRACQKRWSDASDAPPLPADLQFSR